MLTTITQRLPKAPVFLAREVTHQHLHATHTLGAVPYPSHQRDYERPPTSALSNRSLGSESS